MAISRHYQYSEFPERPTYANKIIIFADRIRGWQFYPAEEIIYSNPHAGFIVLLSLMHYFEMIGKYIDGVIGERESEKYFKIGFKDVSSFLGPGISDLSDLEIKNIYNKVRNALYHTGITGHVVVLTGEPKFAIEIKDSIITINPRELVCSLNKHLDSYVERLYDPNETIIRQNFEKRFDYLHG